MAIEINENLTAGRDLKALIAEEAKRAAELTAQGMIKRLWRIPGRWANWGLWEAVDEADLRLAIESLPFFRFMRVEIHPLEAHPSDPWGRDVRQLPLAKDGCTESA